MKTHDMRPISLVGTAALALGLWIAVPAAASQQAASPPRTTDAIEEHLDEADDLLETLLDWRLAITATVAGDERRTPPTEPMPTHTLIPLDRQQVERLVQLVNAAATMVPRATGARATRADLRAHAEKAQESARELMPAPDRPVGTSGSVSNIAMVDRAALQRLEVEVEAMEMLVRASHASTRP